MERLAGQLNGLQFRDERRQVAAEGDCVRQARLLLLERLQFRVNPIGGGSRASGSSCAFTFSMTVWMLRQYAPAIMVAIFRNARIGRLA